MKNYSKSFTMSQTPVQRMTYQKHKKTKLNISKPSLEMSISSRDRDPIVMMFEACKNSNVVATYSYFNKMYYSMLSSNGCCMSYIVKSINNRTAAVERYLLKLIL